MMFHVLTEIFLADGFVALLPFLAAKEAALIAEKFHLCFQGWGKGIELPESFVQSKIRNNIPESRTLCFLQEIIEVR